MAIRSLTIPDSSVHCVPDRLDVASPSDNYIREGIVKSVRRYPELVYVVEATLGLSCPYPVECKPLQRFSGPFNHEEIVMGGYATGSEKDEPPPDEYKPGDKVLIAFLNGNSTTGVVLGALMHPALTAYRPPLTKGTAPVHRYLFNGLNKVVAEDGTYKVTFNGRATNYNLLTKPVGKKPIPAPTYGTASGSYYKFDSTGSFEIGDNKEQTIRVDKPGGFIAATTGANSIKLTKDGTADIVATQKTTVASKIVALGDGAASEPFVLGNELKSWLEKLIDAIDAITYLGNLGAPVTGSLNQGDFASLKNQLEKILSKQTFGQRGEG